MLRNLFVYCLIGVVMITANAHHIVKKRHHNNHSSRNHAPKEVFTVRNPRNVPHKNITMHMHGHRLPENGHSYPYPIVFKTSEDSSEESRNRKSNAHNTLQMKDNEDHSIERKTTNNKKAYSTTHKPVIHSTKSVNTNTSTNSANGNKSINKSNKVVKNKKRICEKKYAEIISRIFPDNDDEDDEDLNERTLAAPGEYPHMAAIGFATSTDKFDFKCGGSLISERFVITAAHCTNQTGQRPSRVRIGDLNLKIRERYLEPQNRQIKNIFVHPQYTSTSYYNDIALLELARDVEFTEFVRPIRLWVRPDIPYLKAFAMGYGSTAFGKVQTNRLSDLNLTIVDNVECNRKLPAMPEAELGIIESQICALDYDMNRDTCQGDSGGPLQLNLHGKQQKTRKFYHLIGITSYGLFCRSGYPSVYTRVSSYLDWIESIVWPEYNIDGLS